MPEGNRRHYKTAAHEAYFKHTFLFKEETENQIKSLQTMIEAKTGKYLPYARIARWTIRQIYEMAIKENTLVPPEDNEF